MPNSSPQHAARAVGRYASNRLCHAVCQDEAADGAGMPRGMVHRMSGSSMLVRLSTHYANTAFDRHGQGRAYCCPATSTPLQQLAQAHQLPEVQMVQGFVQTLDQQLSEKRRWTAPMPAYRRERAAQAQRARLLEAVHAALQQKAAASELARCFLRGKSLARQSHAEEGVVSRAASKRFCSNFMGVAAGS